MKPTRRQILCLSAGASLGTGVLALLLRTGDDSPVGQRDAFQAVSRTSWALGTDVAITAVHPDPSAAERAIDAAFEELAVVESLMSIYRNDSELCRLNRDGVLPDPHPHFVAVLRAAQTLSRRSGGAFDVTVQPLWSAYAKANRTAGLRDTGIVSRAKEVVDWRRVEVSDERIRLRGQGTAITLNGIAQGFAADCANAAIRSHGVEHALIDAGEFSSLGAKSSDAPWTIGIQHPRAEDAYVAVAKLMGRCLATSGDYATSFTADHRLHHLLDPRTGESPTELASVSVCAATAMEADALSTATFVLGVEQGMKLIAETPQADALMVRKDGQSFVTGGFPVAHGFPLKG